MWSLLLLLCLCSAGSTHSQSLDHRFFLVKIIEKYGHNGSITYEGFERLYKNLGLGEASENSTLKEDSHKTAAVNSTNEILKDEIRHSRTSRGINLSTERDSSEEQLASLVDQHEEVTIISPPSPGTGPPQCLAPAQLLAVYGVPRSGSGLSPVSFLHLCPAIIYQLDQRLCTWEQHTVPTLAAEAIVIPYSSWFFAVMTILVISVSGLLCVAIVPLLQKAFISQLISFLVALAVGTLLGDAFLHLIPHALTESHGHGGHQNHTDSVLKTGLMFLTVVFFFTFEAVLNLKRANKNKNNKPENATYMTVNVSVHQTEKEIMQMVEEVPPTAPPQQVGEAHGHSHSNTAVMVILGDGLHNLTDGLAVGAAFSGGLAPGFATAFAVFTHELPHELGDFAVLLRSGVTVRKALLYNVVSSVLSLFGTAVGLVVGNFGDSTRWIYAITAGSFIYIALSNLVPEINRQKSSCRTIVLQLLGILCGGGIMGCIALYEHDIQHLFS